MPGTHFQSYVASQVGFKRGDKLGIDAGQGHDVNVATKVVHIAFDTADIDTGVPLLTLPAGSALLALHVRITEAWNSGTSDEISVGHGAGLDEFIDGEDAQTPGLVDLQAGAIPPEIDPDEDTEIEVKVDSAGTAATEGAAEIILVYTV